MRLALLALVFSACSTGVYEGTVFRRGKLVYETGTLGPDWKRISVEDANLAFKHKNGGAIICNAICGEQDIRDLPLDVLVNHTLFGVDQTRELEREELVLDGRGALRVHVVGTMDGVAIELDLVVMKKDNCTFDFQLVAGIDEFKDRRPAFEAFFKAFKKRPSSGEQRP
ncbi:MAG: hypothetical protein IT381_09490 [Deltaproteobacteria bacterium]|nr:hypothetical protein [Deltaproteobacteria bacterium]